MGGLSGGPVFAWHKLPVLHAELVGFIYEYQKSLDLMLVRSTSVIREDGTLDAYTYEAPGKKGEGRLRYGAQRADEFERMETTDGR